MNSIDDIHLMTLGLYPPGQGSGDIQDFIPRVGSKEHNRRSHNSPAYALTL
jgi:hypothetical protein